MRNLKCCTVCLLTALMVCLHFHSSPAQAQGASSVDLRAVFGGREPIGESACASGGGQWMGGGSVRYHFTPRFSGGVEVLYISACDRQGFTFYHPKWSGLLQLALDLGDSRRSRPYLIAGAGVLHNRSRAGQSSRSEFAGGGGFKFFLSDRMFVAPAAQIGGPVFFFRVSGGVGILLGPR